MAPRASASGTAPLPPPLGELEGRKVGTRALRLLSVRPGRFPEEKRFEMLLGGGRNPVLSGIAFEGRPPIRRWMEFRYDPAPLSGGEPEGLFRLLGAAVGPGGHLSVKYESAEHRTTARALAAGVPPPATPLGFLLWSAGCRWFKDWYFSEGWLEGEQKLQGNVPLDGEHRRKREGEAVAEVRAWLRRSGEFDEEVRRACGGLGRRVVAGPATRPIPVSKRGAKAATFNRL
ncbi:MAG: DUF1122 family protein [Halobacteria archaeon]